MSHPLHRHPDPSADRPSPHDLNWRLFLSLLAPISELVDLSERDAALLAAEQLRNLLGADVTLHPVWPTLLVSWTMNPLSTPIRDLISA